MAGIKVPLLVCLLLSFVYTGGVEPKEAPRAGAGLSGCPLFPADNTWNTPIDQCPVHPDSAQYVNSIGAGSYVHADFGSGTWDGGPIGIPYVAVGGDQEKVEVSFYYDDESDPGPYPIPADAPIEGGSGSDGDRHVLVLDRDNCILYELYDAHPQQDGSWTAGSGAVYNLDSHKLRPAGWTSADAAGLPILPGLVRYDEVARGVIEHAVRFTAPQTQRKYVWPARHYASSLTGSQYPPMGQYFRLKAGYDISGFSRDVRVILTALKKYGMILADNGSSWFISGVPDERWDNDILRELHRVKGSDFEAVDVSALKVNPDSGQVQTPGENKTITVNTPGGGETWTTGSKYTITWSSTGVTGAVKILLRKGGSYHSAITSSTANDGKYGWTPSTGLTAGGDYQVRVKSVADVTVQDTSPPFSIAAPGQEEILLNRERLNFGAVTGGVSTGSQDFLIEPVGTGTLSWGAAHGSSWLNLSPSLGTGTGVVSVTADPTGLAAGTYRDTITVTAGGGTGSSRSIAVTLVVKNSSQDTVPSGSFDSPGEGAEVSGSIPVTGWALDDIEVSGVRVLLDRDGALTFIGDAVMVDGARGDVENDNPGVPRNYRAGWGYMLLSYFLPGGGNGSYRLYAEITDVSGRQLVLGPRTIHCDNAGAVEPFGAIDTPGQGGIASGAEYINYGWVLTPPPNSIPTGGSTIGVFVDSLPVGQPVYGLYREDIASLFPDCQNSEGAIGYFTLDTTQYSDGVHTIHWIAEDNAGNAGGIGSRFFQVINTGSRARGTAAPGNRPAPSSLAGLGIAPGWTRPGTEAVKLRKGYFAPREEFFLQPDNGGRVFVKLKQLERMEVCLPSPVSGGYKGHVAVAGRLRPLPAGSTLDAGAGVFHWLPGHGFLGNFELVFLEPAPGGGAVKTTVMIEVAPRWPGNQPPGLSSE